MAKNIEVKILGDASSYQRALGSAQSTTSKFGRAAKVALVGGAAAGLYALGKAAKIGWDEYNQGAKVAAQTNAVIKSTGGVANVTAKHVDQLGVALMEKSGVDDEVIKSGENVLLTFKNIRNEAGRGNDVFDQTTKAALDMSVALGMDLQSSVMALGKALNSPSEGLTKLTRIGVTFSQKQKDLITRLDESGHSMAAQRVILRELRSEFGKSAQAAGQTLGGQIAILRERFNNWAGDMVAKAIPAASKFVDFIGEIADAPNLTTRIKIVWTGVKGAVGDLYDKVREALFGGEAKPLKLPTGQILEWDTSGTQGLVGKLGVALAGVNWSDVGTKIGRAIGAAITFTSETLNKILEMLTAWVDAHVTEIGEVGLKIALSMIAALGDPGFWKRNWQLIGAVILAALPVGKFIKVGAILGETVAKVFGVRAGLIVLRFIDSVLPRLFSRVPGIIKEGFKVVGIIAFVNAAQNLVSRFISWVTGIWHRIPDSLRSALSVVGGIFARAFAPVVGVIQTVISAIQTIRSLLSGTFTVHINVPDPTPGFDVPGVPWFQHGGVMPGPRGRHSLAMVAGGETVLPTHRPGAGGGGGRSRLAVLVGDAEIIEALRQLDSRSGRRSGRGIF